MHIVRQKALYEQHRHNKQWKTDLQAEWQESLFPLGASTMTGGRRYSWLFGAIWHLPAVSAAPSSDSHAELLIRPAGLLPQVGSQQLLLQLLHSQQCTCHCF